MYCSQCGRLLREDEKFCSNCGNRIIKGNITEKKEKPYNSTNAENVQSSLSEKVNTYNSREKEPNTNNSINNDLFNGPKQPFSFYIEETGNKSIKKDFLSLLDNKVNIIQTAISAVFLVVLLVFLFVRGFTISTFFLLIGIALFLPLETVRKLINKKVGFSNKAIIVVASVCLVVGLLTIPKANYSDKETKQPPIPSTTIAERIVTTEKSLETTKTETTTVETSTEPIKKELDCSVALSKFKSGGYKYISPDDLEKYCSNLKGVKFYTVSSVSSLSADSVSCTLAEDKYMMSSFKTSQDYSNSLEEGDIIAIFGIVEDYHTYKIMGTSVQIKDAMVFAVGNEANKYKKDKTDSSFSKYLKVTEEVASANKNSVSESEYKALCKTLGYTDILRNPDYYEGKYCKVSGTVDQIVEGWFDTVSIYVVDSNGNKWECTYYYKDGETRVLEGDKVTFYGICKGTTNSTTILGKQVTLPYVSVDYIR